MEDLKLIAEYCRKTLATIGGNGYSEVILYQKSNGSFEIHTYRDYDYLAAVEHCIYSISEKDAKRLNQKIKRLRLNRFHGKNGAAMGGGEEVVKYISWGKMVRVTTSNLPFKRHYLIAEAATALYAFASKENRIFEETISKERG